MVVMILQKKMMEMMEELFAEVEGLTPNIEKTKFVTNTEDTSFLVKREEVEVFDDNNNLERNIYFNIGDEKGVLRERYIEE